MEENRSSLYSSVSQFIQEKSSYYGQWVFNKPIVISQNEHKSLQKLQRLMFKMITHFVNHYDDYFNLMPVSDSAKKVIDIFSQQPYSPGTYRTDFVYDENHQVKIIEITCRFSLNTVFETAIYDSIANAYASNKLQEFSFDRSYDSIFPYLEKFYESAEEIIILKGDDLKNASRIFKGIFENTGMKVTEVRYDELHSFEDRLEKAWLISELTIEEIESLSEQILSKLAQSNLTNDFRTALLIHDKRFFSVLGNEDFLSEALTTEEIEDFKKFYIPTYSYGDGPDLWADAKEHKEKWILKHRAKGKSKSIYAGLVTSEEDWAKVFESDEISDFIIQEWIPQKTYKGKIEEQSFEDFVTGTLLFFNNHYFGLGPFRTSSFPVTNVVDDRKIGGLALDESPENLNEEEVLAFIG